jgi:hypothetical protein
MPKQADWPVEARFDPRLARVAGRTLGSRLVLRRTPMLETATLVFSCLTRRHIVQVSDRGMTYGGLATSSGSKSFADNEKVFASTGI